MSPEIRTGSGFGPRPKRARLLAGCATASLTLTMLGLTTPAVAADTGTPVAEGVFAACSGYFSDGVNSILAAGGGDWCGGGRGPQGPRGDRGDRGPQGPRGDRGPAGPAGPCTDIDSTEYFALDVSELTLREELSVALRTNGRVFVGQRDLELNGEAGTNDYAWVRVDDNTGYPTGTAYRACSVSVSVPSAGTAAAGDTAYVKVLFQNGEVWELPGARTGSLQTDSFDFSGSTWVAVDDPLPA
ncbi:hypothetical protein V1460_01225 [Streptomyces sp. SCSIO 30461]|uniref:hypothetical protein n=1 Tax=Streptomyces sp. SCSIO 30461 TaxID=3118085 RepID=UPI0030CF284D